MAWNWGHNFPTSPDTFTPPIDYPTSGWQKILSAWFSDIYQAINQGQKFWFQQLGIDRGDPASPDLSIGDLTTDGNWHDMDFSAFQGGGAFMTALNVVLFSSAAAGAVMFRKKGHINGNNMGMAFVGPGQPLTPQTILVGCDEDGKVQYKADNVAWDTIDITVRTINKS